MASLWRSETNRLVNSANVYQAASTLLGTYHKDRRESFVDQFVNDTLSVEPIRWLLREPSSKEDVDQRDKRLRRIFKMAVEGAALMGNIRGHIDFEGLAELPETFTSVDRLNKRVVAHEYNFLYDDHTRLDGGRILMAVYPGIVRRYTCARQDRITEYYGANVVVGLPKGEEVQK
jgi:hypothetical protein